MEGKPTETSYKAFMPLHSFPNELLLMITKELDKPKDINSLLQTNHRFAHLLTPILHDIALQDKHYGEAALFWAATSGHESMVKLLLEKGIDIDVRDGSRKLIHCAPGICDDATVQLVLKEGANLIIGHENREHSALQWAALYESESTVALLLSKGADTSVKNSDGQTALCLAAERKHKAIISLLLEKVDVASRDKYQRTPLHVAAEHCDEIVARSLLERGADSNAVGMNLLTPLLVAVQRGDEVMPLVKTLLEYGASTGAQDTLERMALHFAAAVKGGKGVRTLELLLEKGADVNARDNYQRTPLHVAVQYKCPVVGLLLEKGAAIDVQDIFGRTALLLADQRGSDTVVRFLLDKGADATIADSCGRMVSKSVLG